MRILLVEDDPLIGEAIASHVQAEGHALDWAETLDAARRYRQAVDYDLLLLDLSLPDGDGLTLLRDRSRWLGDTSVIVLTARDRLSDRIAGLDAGADDYLVKPFDLDELSARMRAVARRREATIAEAHRVGRLAIHSERREVRLDGELVNLTAREWGLIERLVRRPGALVTREQLENALYDLDTEVNPNALEALVSRVRKKLGRNAVDTVRGLGYRLGNGDR